MIKFNGRKGAILFVLLFSAVSLQTVPAFETEGVWELEHLYSQKISVGTVTDLYPAAPEWSAEMLILGVQFLNTYMAVLHCETPSGIRNAEYRAFYTSKVSSSKSQITFTLEDEIEIVLFLFIPEKGDTVFSYCDAGPQPNQIIGLHESTNKIVFRNHIGFIKKVAD